MRIMLSLWLAVAGCIGFVSAQDLSSAEGDADHLPSAQAVKALEELFTWYDKIDPTQLRRATYVHAVPSREPVSLTMMYPPFCGFQLPNKNDEIVIMDTGGDVHTFAALRAVDSRRKTVTIEKADLGSIDIHQFNGLATPHPRQICCPGRAFGYRESRVLARFRISRAIAAAGNKHLACEVTAYEMSSHKTLHLSLDHVKTLRTSITKELSQEMFRQAILALSDEENSRRAVAERFQAIIDHFPESVPVSAAREHLQAMRQAEGRSQVAKPAVTTESHRSIARLIRDLQGDNVQAVYHDAGRPFRLRIQGQHGAAARLYALGFSTVPQLIAALNDSRLTRGITHCHRAPAYYYGLRVCDCAEQILMCLGQTSFRNNPQVPFSLLNATERAETMQRLRQWWANVNTNGIEATLADRISSIGYDVRRDMAELYRIAPARLVPIAEAALKRQENTHSVPRLIAALVDLAVPEAETFLFREMTEASDLASRWNAAQYFTERNPSAVSEAMRKAWREIVCRRYRHDYQFDGASAVPQKIVSFFICSGQAENVKCLRFGFAGYPTAGKTCILRAIERLDASTHLRESHGTAFHDAVKDVLVEALLHTDVVPFTENRTDEYRVCDYAGRVFAGRWPDHYVFNRRGNLVDRDQQRFTILNSERNRLPQSWTGVAQRRRLTPYLQQPYQVNRHWEPVNRIIRVYMATDSLRVAPKYEDAISQFRGKAWNGALITGITRKITEDFPDNAGGIELTMVKRAADVGVVLIAKFIDKKSRVSNKAVFRVGAERKPLEHWQQDSLFSDAVDSEFWFQRFVDSDLKDGRKKPVYLRIVTKCSAVTSGDEASQSRVP